MTLLCKEKRKCRYHISRRTIVLKGEVHQKAAFESNHKDVAARSVGVSKVW